MRTKRIYCPAERADVWDCPYYKDGECGIENPMMECDDFNFFYDPEENEVFSNEERTAFE